MLLLSGVFSCGEAAGYGALWQPLWVCAGGHERIVLSRGVAANIALSCPVTDRWHEWTQMHHRLSLEFAGFNNR